MKPKVLAGAGAICLIVVMWLIWRPQSFEDRFDEVMDDLTSYHLKGDMEITKGEEVKSYVLDVAYQASEKQDFFRVSLYDKALNQEQTIIRNQEGVFVVTPSLNQVFKFEGDWPLNTPKPYLLQSMAEIIKGKTAQIKEKKDGYLVSSPVTYPNNPTFHHEELFFHKEGDVKWIHIYDKDNTSQMKIVFHECEYNRRCV